MTKRIKFFQKFLLIFIIAASLCNSYAAHSSDSVGFQRIFDDANNFYKENRYDESVRGYNKILDLGYESSSLYYNLANAYFKKGRLGKAVLNYERAKALMSNDSDLRSNYDYALSSLEIGPQVFFGNWFERLLDRLFAGIGVNFLTVILSLSYWAIFLILILSLFFVNLRKFFRIFAVFLPMLFLILAFSLYRKVYCLNHSAVVIVKEAQAKFEPIDGATTHFTSAEGSKIEMLESIEGWHKIRRADGKIGWIKKENMEPVYRRHS